MQPETHYAKSGDVNVAYQVVGDGPLDLVYVPGWVSNIELMWEEPGFADFLTRLASFSRLILFDKRGTGLSDRVPNADLPNLEQRMDDVRAVMDAAGSEQAALLGHSEGGNMCALFAATYPERVTALVLVGSFAKRIRTSDYPWAPTAEEREETASLVEREWPNALDLDAYAPSTSGDRALQQRILTYYRHCASPGAAATLLRMNSEIDIRAILPTIQAPTLVLTRTHDRDVRAAESRWLAEQIPGGRFVELPGDDHVIWVGEVEHLLAEVEEFLTGSRPPPSPDRALSTVLFTDIVGSTEQAVTTGDRRWRELLNAHHMHVRKQLDRYRGLEIDTAGDGFFATFDGPARAVQCAAAIRDSVRTLGLEIRSGVHTGEVELADGRVTGIAVHTGARVAAQAAPGEVLVSSTVRDLVAGSGIRFEDRGEHELKGVGSWRLYSVVDA